MSDFVAIDTCRGRVLVSQDKMHLLADKHVTFGGRYAIVCIEGRKVQLSHLVAGRPPRGKMKDHINGDRLDNRNENLRDVDSTQNNQNRRKAANTSSRYLGVSWNKELQKWRADVHVDGVRGQRFFHTEEEAARQYDLAAVYFHYVRDPKFVPRLNGLLSVEELEAARLTCPWPRPVWSTSTKYVTWRNPKYSVEMPDLDGRRRYHGRFDTETAAKAKVQEIEAAQEVERDRRHKALPITYNKDGVAIIVLNQTRGTQRHVLVDADIWHLLSRWGWNAASENHYPSGSVLKKTWHLHKFIWHLMHPNEEISEGFLVDHVNHDLFDCRRANLRLLTVAENNHNCRKRKTTSSKFVGVRKYGEKWRAGTKKIRCSPCLYDTEVEAHEAYLAASKHVFPRCYL